MKEQVEKPIWVAVKVVRGFPVEVRGFRTKSKAEEKERKWRKTMNRDYDESGVLPLFLSET